MGVNAVQLQSPEQTMVVKADCSAASAEYLFERFNRRNGSAEIPQPQAILIFRDCRLRMTEVTNTHETRQIHMSKTPQNQSFTAMLRSVNIRYQQSASGWTPFHLNNRFGFQRFTAARMNGEHGAA